MCLLQHLSDYNLKVDIACCNLIGEADTLKRVPGLFMIEGENLNQSSKNMIAFSVKSLIAFLLNVHQMLRYLLRASSGVVFDASS